MVLEAEFVPSVSLVPASILVKKCAGHYQGFTHSQYAIVSPPSQRRAAKGKKIALEMVKKKTKKEVQVRKTSEELRNSCAHYTMMLTVEVSMKRDTSCSARIRNYSHTSLFPPMPLYRNISGVPTIKRTSGNTHWSQESPTNNQKVRDGDLEERNWTSTGTNLAPGPELVMELVCCGCKAKCEIRRFDVDATTPRRATLNRCMSMQGSLLCEL